MYRRMSSPTPGLQVIDAPGWRLDRTWHQCVEQPLFVDGEAALPGLHVADFALDVPCMHHVARGVHQNKPVENVSFMDSGCKSG